MPNLISLRRQDAYTLSDKNWALYLGQPVPRSLSTWKMPLCTMVLILNGKSHGARMKEKRVFFEKKDRFLTALDQ